jgi:CheY-like chemotaxis protein
MVANIFIVEDDARSRRLLGDVLGFHGYALQAFETGEAAIAALAGASPALVLLDIQLPGISGFGVLAHIRASAHLQNTKVVAVTASVMDTDRRRIRDEGFDDYLPKPVNLDDLLALVERYAGPPPRALA